MRHRHGMSVGRSIRGITRAAGAFVIVVALGEGTLAQQAESPPQDALAGSRVFGQEGCGRCHAVRGWGGDTTAPDLAGVSDGSTFFELAAAMWNHLPGMSARMQELGISRPRLTDREAGDLIAFLYWLGYFDGPGDVERGRRLFADRRCILCHQVGGAGGVVGPPLDRQDHGLVPIELATSMWNHAPAMSAAMDQSGVSRPRLTARELNDLIAFLEDALPEVPSQPQYVIPGPSERGRALFATKMCVRCHPVQGSGSASAPDLAAGGHPETLMGFAVAMWNKAPRMMAAMEARGLSVPQLSASEMADVVGYLYAARYFAEAGDANRGRRTLEVQGCLGCHAMGGAGGGSASDFTRVRRFETVAAVTAALWNHILLTSEQAGNRFWPRLRGTQVADIAAYLMQR